MQLTKVIFCVAPYMIQLTPVDNVANYDDIHLNEDSVSQLMVDIITITSISIFIFYRVSSFLVTVNSVPRVLLSKLSYPASCDSLEVYQH